MAECMRTRQLVKLLKSQGAKVIVLAANRFSEPGLPDRIIVHPDWQGFVEFKDIFTKVTMLQMHRQREIMEHGLPAVVVRFSSTQRLTISDVSGRKKASTWGRLIADLANHWPNWSRQDATPPLDDDEEGEDD